MIKTAIEGAREFGLARVGTVLASSAEAARSMTLLAISGVAPSLIILGTRGSTISVFLRGVISCAALAFTLIVSRRGVGIVQLLKGMRLLGRRGLYKINTIVRCVSCGGSLRIWKWIIGITRGDMVRCPLLIDG